MLNIVSGNIMNATEDYVAHQCNNLSVTVKGLAESIFNTYPHANPHHTINTIRHVKLGSIEVMGGCAGKTNKNLRGIINLYAQHGPGRHSNYQKSYHQVLDCYRNRQMWFRQCLDAISKLPINSIAFPWRIGCGLGGGNWDQYMDMLLEFANKNPNIRVTVYRFVLKDGIALNSLFKSHF